MNPPRGRWRPRWRPLLADAGAIALVALVGFLDARTGPYLAFSSFYVVPVLVASWHGSRGSGAFLAIASAVVWTLADYEYAPDALHPFVPVWNLLMRVSTLVVVAALVRMLHTQLALAKRQGRTDALTGLVARGWFLRLLEGEVRRTRRYGHPLSLAYIDVDDFKGVNDAHGHDAGDRLLRRIAHTLREGTRDIDVPGRMGGDEFMLLMPETEPVDARLSIERLAEALREATRREGLPVTFSIGVLTFVGVPDDPEEAVRRVDELMYEVKRAGKDGFLHRVAE